MYDNQPRLYNTFLYLSHMTDDLSIVIMMADFVVIFNKVSYLKKIYV